MSGETAEPTDVTTDQKFTGRPLGSPVKNCSGKPSLLGHTFILTISPKGDVSPDCEAALLKWCKRMSTCAYVVAERGANNKRHLHFALYFEKARCKQNLQEDMWKRVKKWHGDSISRFAVHVANMYDHRWYDEYLKKEADVEILLDTYDRDVVGKHFPTAEQQLHFIALQGQKIVDSCLHNHLLAWEETTLPVSLRGALDYLRGRMFIKKDMIVIQDERRVRQLALSLYRFRSGDISTTPDEDEWIARNEPRVLSYAVPEVSSKPSVPPHNVGNPCGSKKLWANRVFKEGDRYVPT